MKNIIIIGGGIVGVTTALYLRQFGFSGKITILEKGGMSGAQSQQNWGFVRCQGRDYNEIPLMIHSLKLWQEISTTLNDEIGFQVKGNLILAHKKKQLKKYAKWLVRARKLGVNSELLDSNELTQRFPHLQQHYMGGLFTPGDAQAEPRLAIPKLAQYIKEACDIECIENAQALDFIRSNGKICGVTTSVGDFFADHFLVAAGAWSNTLIKKLGCHIPQQRLMVSVQRGKTNSPVLHDIPTWAPEVAFRKRHNGEVIIAHGTKINCNITWPLLAEAYRYLPAFWDNKHLIKLMFKGLLGQRNQNMTDPHCNVDLLRKSQQSFSDTLGIDVDIQQQWAGYIDMTPDALPVIDTIDNVAIATGLSGHGFGIGPAVGYAVAETILAKKPSYDLSPFSLERFSRKIFLSPFSLV